VPLSCEWDLTGASGDASQLSIPVNFDASDDGCPGELTTSVLVLLLL
jgi:hypothetical protein